MSSAFMCVLVPVRIVSLGVWNAPSLEGLPEHSAFHSAVPDSTEELVSRWGQ